jgi:hypothetical protein
LRETGRNNKEEGGQLLNGDKAVNGDKAPVQSRPSLRRLDMPEEVRVTQSKARLVLQSNCLRRKKSQVL